MQDKTRDAFRVFSTYYYYILYYYVQKKFETFFNLKIFQFNEFFFFIFRDNLFWKPTLSWSCMASLYLAWYFWPMLLKPKVMWAKDGYLPSLVWHSLHFSSVWFFQSSDQKLGVIRTAFCYVNLLLPIFWLFFKHILLSSVIYD